MQRFEVAQRPLEKLKHGYNTLLDIDAGVWDRAGFVLKETIARDRPEWANWVIPLWLFRLQSVTVCSLSPRYAARARAVFGQQYPHSLLAPDTLVLARQVIDVTPSHELEWVQSELLYYPSTEPPAQSTQHHVEQLRWGTPGAEQLLRTFDGGVFVVRAPDGGFAAHAAIKNKGILQELAVGTDEPYRRTGMGKAVVARAVAHILAAGRVATYWPDTLQNAASYALARSVGFQTVAEMCFCCYAEPNWRGFAVPA